MKRIVLSAVLVFILILTGCTLLPWVKDGNNIYDWFTKPVEDAVYYYKYTYHNNFIDISDNYEFKYLDIDENSDNIVVMVNNDGTNRYIVADRDENLIFYGKDQFFSGYSEEEVYLEAPVTIDNTWLYKNEERTIAAIDTTVEIAAGKFSDVIKVKVMGDDVDYTGHYFWSISKGLLYSEIEYADGSYSRTELIDIHE